MWSLPACIGKAVTADPWRGPHGIVCWDAWLHAGHIPEEGKSPTSNPRLHVLQTSAILYFCVRYIVEKANDEYVYGADSAYERPADG